MRKAIAVVAIVSAGILTAPVAPASATAKLARPGTVTVIVPGSDTVLTLDTKSTTGTVQLRTPRNEVVVVKNGSRTGVITLTAHIKNSTIRTCGTQNWSLNDGAGVKTAIKIRFRCRSRFEDLRWGTTTDGFIAEGILRRYDPAGDRWVPSPDRVVHVQEQQGRQFIDLNQSATQDDGSFGVPADHDWGTLIARVSTPATDLYGGVSSSPQPLSIG